MKDLGTRVQELYESNRRAAGGFQYTVPSPESYPYQWFWDSCFHAIVQSLWNPEDAKKEIRALLSAQLESGLLPHVIYWEKKEVLNIEWGTAKNTSSLTQPPIIAYAILRIFEKDKDKAFLEETYPALLKYYRHLFLRDTRKHHLIGIINPDESGEDNSPRFDVALELNYTQTWQESNKKRFELFEKNKECHFDAPRCMKNFFWVKDVAFNVYLVENLYALATIAHLLKEDSDYKEFTEKATAIKSAMKERMFEDGVFWTICGPDHEKVKVKTWALFAPLLIDLYSKEEAQDLIERHFHNKDEFESPYLLPTVARNEPSYNPEEPRGGKAWEHPNWRGPIWMASNWFTYRALRKHGFDAEAQKLRDHSYELLEKSGFREYFHPQTGEGMGAHDFTWCGLVLDME